jgi:MFS family permease
VSAAEEAAPLTDHDRQAEPRRWAGFAGPLMFAYFGTSVALFAPLQNVLPRMIEDAGGAPHKAAYLGMVTGFGAIAAMIFNPLAGYFSDRLVRADNRSSIVLAGLIGGALSLGALGFQTSIAGIAICWTLCQATINIAYSSMAASVVDHVDRHDWGFAWGLIAVAQALGLIFGFAAVALIFPGVKAGMAAVTVSYAVCLAPLVLVLYRLPRVDRQPAAPSPVRTLITGGHGFGAVWAGKFLVMLANSIALLYLYYYLQDVIHYGHPGSGQLILVVVATAATILATVTIGRIADRSGGYRHYAVAATVVMAVTGFVLAVIGSWGLVIACAFGLGAGYGAFQSVSQALSMTVLPDPGSAARDLGIINIATAIPQVIGPPVAALVVSSGAGYRGLFAFAGALALAASVVFARVPALPWQTAPAPPAALPNGAIFHEARSGRVGLAGPWHR